MSKILIDGRLLTKTNTGIGRYTYQVIKSYVDNYGADQVIVIANQNIEVNGAQLIITNYKPFNIVHFFFFFFFIKKIEFDIYHSTVYSGLFYRFKGRKSIITVHDLMYRIVPGFFSKYEIINKLAIIYYDFIVRRSLKNSNLIISVSLATQKDIKLFFNMESEVVPEGINILTTSNQIEFVSKDIKKHEYFLYVGNLRRQKNIDFLIDTFELSNTAKKLILIGNYSNIPSKYLNRKNVIFGGYKSDIELSALYKNCSAFIFPSFYEGFGLPVLEALANGALVFSSDAGSLNEFDCANIFHFNPYDSCNLKYLIENVDHLRFDQLECDRFLNNYTWEKCMGKMHSIISLKLK